MTKEKPKYGFMSNTLFAVSTLWHCDRSILFYIFGNVPVILLLPLCSVYLPKVIVSAIEDSKAPLYMITGVLFITLSMLTLSVLQQFIAARMELHHQKVMSYMKATVSKKAMNVSYEVIDRPSTQVMFKKVFEMIQNGEEEGLQAMPILFATLLGNILGFTVYTGILSTLNPLITVLIIASTFITFFVNKAINKWVFKNRDNWLKLDVKLAYLTYKSGSFDCAKDIRLYHMKQWFGDVFKNFMAKRIKWTVTMQGLYYLGNGVEALFVLLRDGFAYGYLIYLIWKNTISVADFVLYFGIISGFSSWCMEIIKSFSKANKINFNLCDIRSYLELQEDTTSPYENKIRTSTLDETAASCVASNPTPCQIELENVSYCYEGEDTPTLKNIDLLIKPGEKIAVVGANGAGKTTFVKLVCGLYTPTTGTVKVNDCNSTAYDKQTYYNLFAPVFQDVRLLPMSIVKNITLCDKDQVDEARLLECLSLSGMDEVVAKLPDGLDTLLVRDINEKAIQLSGGEQQKLMLARALYKNAPIMILDEPTAALDPIAENAMYLKYNELTAHTTSIFISHRLASTRFCDRIILIENGEIVEIGSHEELLALGQKYAKMFEIQAQYYKEQEEEDEHEESIC